MATEPPANGQKPEKLTLSVVAFHLDTIDAVHIALAKALEGRNGHVAATLTGQVDQKNWKVKQTDYGPIAAVSYRFVCSDVTPAATSKICAPAE